MQRRSVRVDAKAQVGDVAFVAFVLDVRPHARCRRSLAPNLDKDDAESLVGSVAAAKKAFYLCLVPPCLHGVGQLAPLDHLLQGQQLEPRGLELVVKVPRDFVHVSNVGIHLAGLEGRLAHQLYQREHCRDSRDGLHCCGGDLR